MKEFLSIVIIILISALAGGIVSLPMSFSTSGDPLTGFLAGTAAGAVIGLCARFAFTIVYIRLRNRRLPAFAAMAGTVAAGTALDCLITGVAFIPAGLVLIAASIVVALILTALIFSYSQKLNRKLLLKKEKLSKKEESPKKL